MRNKAELNNDFESVIKPELRTEIDIVQMCAHDIRHMGVNYVDLQPEHTISGSKIRFNFKGILREGTSDVVEGLIGNPEVEDLEYIGMEAMG